MNFFIKKVLPLSLILFFFIFILFLLFPKKLTKEKIENKINQIETALSREVAPMKSESEGFKLIKMAFIEQAPEKNWDQPWQDACEEAALLTVDFYYKNINEVSIEIAKNSILKMIEFENTKNYTHDINISQMATVSQNYLNYQTKIIDNPTVEEIKKYLNQNIPIIITANGKTLYQENKHFKSGGPYYHSAVILGYDDDKKQFTVHDVGTQFGAYFKYSYSLLMESIHDFPSSGKKEDINNGPKKVLILLK